MDSNPIFQVDANRQYPRSAPSPLWGEGWGEGCFSSQTHKNHPAPAKQQHDCLHQPTRRALPQLILTASGWVFTQLAGFCRNRFDYGFKSDLSGRCKPPISPDRPPHPSGERVGVRGFFSSQTHKNHPAPAKQQHDSPTPLHSAGTPTTDPHCLGLGVHSTGRLLP